jgi:hypothetical protein
MWAVASLLPPFVALPSPTGLFHFDRPSNRDAPSHTRHSGWNCTLPITRASSSHRRPHFAQTAARPKQTTHCFNTATSSPTPTRPPRLPCTHHRPRQPWRPSPQQPALPRICPKAPMRDAEASGQRKSQTNKHKRKRKKKKQGHQSTGPMAAACAQHLAACAQAVAATAPSLSRHFIAELLDQADAV